MKRSVGVLLLLTLAPACTPTKDAPSVAGSPTDTAPGGSNLISVWRTEYWRDMQVNVPADWGFGGAPLPHGGTESGAIACGAVALVSASGERLAQEDPTMAYVGRPIAQTDVCAVYPWIGPNAGPPQAPYVWLGAAVEPGVVELGDDFVQETVEVNGSLLTVATQDAGLRRQILDSATGGETCLPVLDEDGVLGGPMSPAEASTAAMTVCAYRRSEEGGPIQLTYATHLGSKAVAEYLEALQSAPPPLKHCSASTYPESEWAVLEITGNGREPMQHVVHFGCPGIDTDAGSVTMGSATVGLTPQLVRPWAVEGIGTVLYGPTGGKGAMLDSFIGPQG
jgi:hypothetical protein